MHVDKKHGRKQKCLVTETLETVSAISDFDSVLFITTTITQYSLN